MFLGSDDKDADGLSKVSVDEGSEIINDYGSCEEAGETLPYSRFDIDISQSNPSIEYQLQ